MGVAPQKEKHSPNPLLHARFWLLVGTTIRMKLTHRIRGNREYTEHLTKFYTRSKTKHVEVYGDAYQDVRPLVMELANPQPGDFVLDVATGGGYQAAAFAEAGHRVVGVDYVQDRARLALEQHGNHHITWGAADMSRLPFKTNSVDILTITFALHDLPLDIQMKGLAEMRRVARKRVVIAEPRKPDNRFRAFLYGHLGELLDESLHFSEFLRRDFDGALAESGLKVTHMERIRGDLAAIYVCEPTPIN
jgi:ubiquinone/menaquinone biosynthesis C-methylase UbiE